MKGCRQANENAKLDFDMDSLHNSQILDIEWIIEMLLTTNALGSKENGTLIMYNISR